MPPSSSPDRASVGLSAVRGRTRRPGRDQTGFTGGRRKAGRGLSKSSPLEKGEGCQLGILYCVASLFTGSESFGKETTVTQRPLGAFVGEWWGGGEGRLGTRLWRSSTQPGALGSGVGGGEITTAPGISASRAVWGFSNSTFPDSERGWIGSSDDPQHDNNEAPNFLC